LLQCQKTDSLLRICIENVTNEAKRLQILIIYIYIYIIFYLGDRQIIITIIFYFI